MNYTLLHFTNFDFVPSIIADGFLKPSKLVSKHFAGKENSDFIFFSFMLNSVKIGYIGYPMYFSIDILYHFPFYMAIGWPHEKIDEHYFVDPSRDDVSKKLKWFERKILKYLKNPILNISPNIHQMMSNQILIKDSISLKKYLLALPDPSNFSSDIFDDKTKLLLKRLIKKKYKKAILLHHIVFKPSDIHKD
jgi:hypothetical protein